MQDFNYLKIVIRIVTEILISCKIRSHFPPQTLFIIKNPSDNGLFDIYALETYSQY